MKNIIAILSIVCFFASNISVSVSYAALPGSTVDAVSNKTEATNANDVVNNDSTNTNKTAVDKEKKEQEQSDIKKNLTIGLAAGIFWIIGTLLTFMNQ